MGYKHGRTFVLSEIGPKRVRPHLIAVLVRLFNLTALGGVGRGPRGPQRGRTTSKVRRVWFVNGTTWAKNPIMGRVGQQVADGTFLPALLGLRASSCDERRIGGYKRVVSGRDRGATRRAEASPLPAIGVHVLHCLASHSTAGRDPMAGISVL